MHSYILTEISIPVLDYLLIADVYTTNNTKNVLLFFAGYGSDKERNHEFLKGLVEATGLTVVCMNLSGHGIQHVFDLNDTRPSQHIIEAASLYEWAQDRFKNTPIILMGNSYGGYIAAQLSTYKKINALVLRAPTVYPANILMSKQRDIDRETISSIYRKDEDALKINPLFVQLSKPHKFASLVMVHDEDEDVPKQTTDSYKNALGGSSYLGGGIQHSFGSPNNNKESISLYLTFLYKWLKDNTND